MTLKRVLLVALAAVAVVLLGGAAAVLSIDYPAADIAPGVFEPLVITDRNGVVLRRTASQTGRTGRERWVPLDRIRSHAILALIVSEDKRFFEHSGVDLAAIGRAALLNIKAHRFGYGASTITMQLMRMIHSQGAPRSFRNKLKEAALALAAERVMSKQQILEQYFNRAYYGNGAYGIKAAAMTYLGKSAEDLSTGEAVSLALIPRAPGAYDPVRHLSRLQRRRDHVLLLMVEGGQISESEAAWIKDTPLNVSLHRPKFKAPHFCDWVMTRLPAEVKRRGGVVRTTLDLKLQRRLQHRVADHVAGLARRGLRQAGMVVLDTGSGQVLAMVGSPGFYKRGGQLNITTRRRHPGSALKPFVYALALEQGDSAATIAYDLNDVPSRYRVKKVTQKERGPVRYREALAGSYNLAAVHVLERVGEEKLVSRLRQAGVGEVPMEPSSYNLRLALGATRVRLVDLAAGYGFLVRGGTVTRPFGVLEVSSPRGVYWRPAAAPPRRVFAPDVSWLVMDMLSDPEARRPMFGTELPVDDMPFKVALKTGTSRGFADTVAVGVTRELTVAAWAGNFDGTPTQGLTAMTAAAPLVRTGLMLAARGKTLTLPKKPPQITPIKICPKTGLLPGPSCPRQKLEYFRQTNLPKATCN